MWHINFTIAVLVVPSDGNSTEKGVGPINGDVI